MGSLVKNKRKVLKDAKNVIQNEIKALKNYIQELINPF